MAIEIDPITDLPQPPLKTDPTNFASRADTFLDALPDFVTETNAAIVEMNKITSGLDQATPIAAWEGTPTSYDFPDVVAGSDGYSYRCVGTNVVDEDPTTDDGTYWVQLTTPFASEAEVLAGTVTDVAMSPATSLDVIAASLPGTYARDQRWANGGSDTATNRRTLVSPNRVAVYIDGNGYVLSSQSSLDIDTAANWDDSTYATASNRAGKDFYVYACIPSTGREVDLVLSANSTYPDGYTASNSRKIGGFHCLGVSVGTISGHDLTGYLQGDILPMSVWDLLHRPVSAPEGMVYNPGIGHWVDIYLAGIASGELVSRYGVAHQTGDTTEEFHWYKFSQWLGRIGKRMLNQHEFQSASMGSNQGTNITGSADPTNTGGYDDTAGRRMISDIGCESCCGVLYQWGEGDGGGQSAASWEDAFDANDSGVAGQHYVAPNRPRFGGTWSHGAVCGSRSSNWNVDPLGLNSSSGSRGCAEPLSNIG
jgi:hypothetical protein